MMITPPTTSSISQPIHYNTNVINRSYSTIGYDYHHYNPWEKPNYATFNYQQTPYAIGTSTGGITSTDTINKSTTNLNNSTSNFSRRHTESALQPSTSTSIYSSSITNHPSSSPFNYSHTTIHYHPSEPFFGWNNEPSLMRTHSASYRDYSQTTSFPHFVPMNSLTTKSTDNLTQTNSINLPTPNSYPLFFNFVPPTNFSLPPPISIPSSNNSSTSRSNKHSISSNKKRSRLTAQLRNEILKLKANKPTIFVWEIQQNLLQNGTCTSQTLPHATVIQKILNESVINIKEEPKTNVDLVMETLFKKSSSVTICLSPSQSPALSDNELGEGSECSICLETYRSGQEVSILSCSHEYHSSCIKEWMIKSRSCPMCRKDIHNQPQFVTLLI